MFAMSAARCAELSVTDNFTSTVFGTWLAVLGLYDLVFLLVGYAVFDFLLED